MCNGLLVVWQSRNEYIESDCLKITHILNNKFATKNATNLQTNIPHTKLNILSNVLMNHML